MRPRLGPPPAISVSPRGAELSATLSVGQILCSLVYAMLLPSLSLSATWNIVIFLELRRNWWADCFLALLSHFRSLSSLPWRPIRISAAWPTLPSSSCTDAATGWSLRLLSITRLECYSFFEVKLLLLQFDARELDRAVVGTGGWR